MIRVLFDELASPRVALALKELGFAVRHIGQDLQPEKGSEDEAVLDHAKRTNQVVLTNNHDMIVLCCEAEESVIWLDPRDKDMTFAAQVLLCFGQISEWQALLQATPGPTCIHARKTKCDAIPLERAKRMALERGKRRRRQEARRKQQAAEGDRLPGMDASGG